MALKSADDVVDALLTALQGASGLSYINDAHIVERDSAEAPPGEFDKYAIVVALGGVPTPTNKIGGWVEQSFPMEIGIWVKIHGATRKELVHGRGTDKGLRDVISDIEAVLVQNDLSATLMRPGRPLPGGRITTLNDENGIAVRAIIDYVAETKDLLG